MSLGANITAREGKTPRKAFFLSGGLINSFLSVLVGAKLTGKDKTFLLNR